MSMGVMPQCLYSNDNNTMENQKLNNDSPNELEPVLALITHQGDLGKSEWYEVVFFYDKWYSYEGSNTFDYGEQVVKWKYAKDCL